MGGNEEEFKAGKGKTTRGRPAYDELQQLVLGTRQKQNPATGVLTAPGPF